jgi:DeoR/GlpR family transcriptional regulator of sugar metabolism
MLLEPPFDAFHNAHCIGITRRHGARFGELFVEDFNSILLDAGSSTAEYISQKIFKHRIYLTILTKSMGATS